MQSVPFQKYKSFAKVNRKCIVCLKNTQSTIWASDKYFKALKCKTCSTVYLNPVLTDKGLNSYYSQNSIRRSKNKNKNKLRKIQYSQDKHLIETFIKRGKVLDMGCENGNFLKILNNSFQKYGFDIDISISKNIKNFAQIEKGDFFKINYKKNFFDLIIFRGVIEHLSNPKDYINKCYNILKKNGLIFFCATPNVDCVTASHYRNKWNLWHPIQHINLFSSKTISKMLEPKRFNLVHESYPYINTPYENFEGDVKKLIKDLSNKKNKLKKSPPFYGSMMSLIFKKK